MPDAPDPETLPTIREALEPYADRFPAAFVDWIRRERPIDSRSTRLPRWLDPESERRASRSSSSGSAPNGEAAATIRCCTRAWSRMRAT